MRYWLLLALPCAVWLPCGCDNGNGDEPDADVDVCGECGETGQACNMSTECPPLQVCHEHRCGCAFERTYEIEVVSASVYDRTATGNCWDGEAPTCEQADVYAVVQVGDTTYTTETVDDTIYAVWNETFTQHVDCHTVYGVWLYDEDSDDDDDLIFEFDSSWGFFFDEDNLRSAGMHICTEGGTQTCVDIILSPM